MRPSLGQFRIRELMAAVIIITIYLATFRYDVGSGIVLALVTGLGWPTRWRDICTTGRGAWTIPGGCLRGGPAAVLSRGGADDSSGGGSGPST